jgi:hypothetical protein
MGKKGGKSGIDEIIGGLAIVLVFGYLRIFHGWGWWVVFPIVFGGVLPMLEGVRKVLSPSGKKVQRLTARQKEEQSEKELLRLAHSHNGVLTPSIAAVGSFLSLGEAERLLDDFVNRGYARLQVRDDGRIEYEFPEFIKSLEG